MVLAAMANPPEHDFAPSWLKIPATEQQKRGQKLSGSSDQWAGHHPDSEGGNKSRHRHYSSTDSSGSYTRPQTAGHPGNYGYRGRETDRRHYPRPGSGSRHHSVDDLNGYHDFSSWSLPHYYPGNYPRRGGSAGPRDGHYRYGDVFHPGSGRGHYNGGGGRGRQRYNSGSRADYTDKDNHQDSGSSSTMGSDGKKKDGKEEQSKNSALSSNDFPSLIGDNSKTVNKEAAKTGNTPSGVWDKPPGAAKVQISGRKVQLIKKAIHNDLPPRDPNMTSRDPNMTSRDPKSSRTSSATDAEGPKTGNHAGSGSRGNRTTLSGSAVPSSGSSSLFKMSSVPQKTSMNDKSKDPPHVPPSKNLTPSPNDPKPTNNTQDKQNTNTAVDEKHTLKESESTRFASSNSSLNKAEVTSSSANTKDSSKAGPAKQTYENSAKDKPVSMTTTRKSSSGYNKPADPTTTQKSVAEMANGKESPTKPVLVQATKPGLVQTSKPVLVNQTSKPVLVNQTSKPVLVNQTSKPVLVNQTSKPVLVNQTSKPVLVNQTSKPVLVQTSTTTTSMKPTIKSMSVKNSGKESPTKPILVQASTKPTMKPMSSKDSPIRPVPVQIKSNSAKFSGKDSPIRPFPIRNSKQGGRDRAVRPGPVQIRSNRLVAKETPTVRPVPVQALNRKSVKEDAISNAKDKPGSQSPVSSYSSLAKEPLSNPTTPPIDIKSSTFSLNKNVNNVDRSRGLQNGGDHWRSINGPLRIEDAERMNGPQHSTSNTEVNSFTNGLDNDVHSNRLELSSSLEAEKRLLQEMGWHEHSDNEEGYAPITEDEMKEFQRRSQQLKKNGTTRCLAVSCLSSSLPNTPMTSIDLDDALSSCSSLSSDDDDL